jgi:hypothetical protein
MLRFRLPRYAQGFDFIRKPSNFLLGWRISVVLRNQIQDVNFQFIAFFERLIALILFLGTL